jgi:hypothetical protein
MSFLYLVMGNHSQSKILNVGHSHPVFGHKWSLSKLNTFYRELFRLTVTLFGNRRDIVCV